MKPKHKPKYLIMASVLGIVTWVTLAVSFASLLNWLRPDPLPPAQIPYFDLNEELTKRADDPCLGAIKPRYSYPEAMLDECGALLDPHTEKRR